LNRNLLETKDLQQNNETHTETQHKLTNGHFEQSDKVQNLAHVEQENDTFLRSDIARRLRADNVLFDVVEKWDSLAEHIRAAIKTLVEKSK